jgi:cytochrome c oxidase cbb3-type subunit 3
MIVHLLPRIFIVHGPRLPHRDRASTLAWVLLVAACSVLGPALARADEGPVLVARSPYSMATTIERVRNAAVGNNFRVVRLQSVDHDFVPSDREDAHRRIVYVCDFGFLSQVLKIEKRIGIFLPCQINVIERQGQVYVLAPNPKAINRVFLRNPRLGAACDELHALYSAILAESTL